MFGVRAGRAFDGERMVPGGALVLVDDGRIAGVEPGAAPASDSCQVLEAPGGTVLPGLVDAHVHLCADGTDGTLDRIGEPFHCGSSPAGIASRRTRRSSASRLRRGVTYAVSSAFFVRTSLPSVGLSGSG
jgi:imidazolonepropionase-like amidohydrolase